MRADDEFFIKPTASHEQPPSKVSKGLLRFDFLNQRGPRRLKKTGFVEVRSFWHIFRSFDRMWTFYILSLQAMIIVAWNGTGSVVAVFDGAVIKKVLSVFITAAGLRFLQALLDIIMNLNALHSLRFTGMLRLFLKLLVSIFWIIILSTSYAHSWENPTSLGKAFDWGNSSAPVYLVAVILYLVPNGIAALFFIFPMLRRVSEESDSMPARFLLWWSQPRLYVGRGMHEGLVDLFKYTFFWIGLLACKLSFSYFVEIKPLVAPTKVILNATDIRYEWHEFFPTGTHNIGALLAVWAPVILVYFMDTQIWYALVSTIWGGFVGAFMRLGEVRTLKMLRARFQALPGTFNAFLVHDDRAHRHHFYISKRLAPYPGEDRMKEAKFAQLWNEIIGSFREEDLINDWEMELMLVPYSADRFMQMDMIQWPSFLLATKTPMAIRMTRDFAMKESSPKDDVLWRKISADPFMVCAVKESYLHLKFVLAEIIEGEEEKRIIDELIDEVEEHKANGTLLDNFRMSELSYLHELFVDLVHYLVKGDPSDRENFIILLQDMLELVLKDMMDSRLSDESTQSLDDARRPQLFTSMEPKPAVRFPPTFSDDASRDIWNEQIRRLSLLLTVEEDAMKIPMNLEARRRLAFFTNSLFMDMPHAPLVHHMIPFSVLTPYYDEEVVYGKKALEMANEDGVSIIFYLQNVYPDEWKHFLERVKPKDAKEIEELDLRAWASYRGQTLSRTVRGMMYYRKALELQAFLDMASDEDVLKGYKVISKNRDTEQKQQGSFWAKLDAIVDMKFTYVATCQMYGAQKRSTDPASHQRAVDILQLMKRYPSLRVAYIDEVEEHDKKVYYSVLVKAVEGFDQEIYRIRLPGSVKIGEGKPENQNHAIIFTRGEGLQTIDMNQDNYLEETLKMRNLLEEFNDRHHGVRLPTILGVRENIFTGSVSSLAWFMSNQETSFVTIGQRILADPLKVRFHYGHPDVFDRLFHITRGGVSKASKVINLSEDIFAGFNSTLRRGNVTHHEYIQVGKGRDVGLNQISMFEAKVANGNGEQTLSRDIYRLGHRFDFFRMMSCYFTTVGFYYNTMIVVLTVYVFLYGRLYLALSGLERSLTNQGHKDNDLSLKAALASQSLVQLGLLMALPMIMEIGLERGFLAALSDFVVMQLQLASVFFTFSLGTKVHYYARTIFHGGAKYRATGREFVVRHVKFAENYRLYSRSHFTKGFEIMMLLIVYNVYGVSPQDAVAYIFITFSMWFLVGTWLFSPFLFNPSGFEWQKIVEDWTDWNKWIYSKGRIGVPPEKSWESWWDEEQEHLQYTGFRGCVMEIILALRFLIYQYGLVYHLDITREHKNISIYGLSWVVILSVFGILKLIAFGRKQFKADFQLIFRMLKGVIFISLLAVIGVMFRFVNLTVQDLFVSVLAFLPTGWGLLLIAQACRPLVGSGVWDSVQALARTYEFIMGLFLFAPVAILAWFPFVSEFQTRLLFNQAFSRGLQISRILAGNKRQRVTD